jgi:hypothetical protein
VTFPGSSDTKQACSRLVHVDGCRSRVAAAGPDGIVRVAEELASVLVVPGGSGRMMLGTIALLEGSEDESTADRTINDFTIEG